MGKTAVIPLEGERGVPVCPSRVWDVKVISYCGSYGKLQRPWAETCDQHATSYDCKQIRWVPIIQFFLASPTALLTPALEWSRNPGWGGGFCYPLCLLPRVEFVKLASEEADVVNPGPRLPRLLTPRVCREAFQHAVSGDFYANQYTKAFLRSLPAPGGPQTPGLASAEVPGEEGAALSGEQANLDVRIHGAEPFEIQSHHGSVFIDCLSLLQALGQFMAWGKADLKKQKQKHELGDRGLVGTTDEQQKQKSKVVDCCHGGAWGPWEHEGGNET